MDHLDSMSEADAYVLYGVFYGFPIIDSTFVEPYVCENYNSITTGEGYNKMSERIKAEISQGKISVASEPVQCIHALGAIFKPNGSIRPITDCKRPIGLSINNAMHKTCYTFSYSNINTVCSFVQPGDYLCVIDISNAYRSVNIFPSHIYFQAFSWTLHDENQVYLDHCLSFGLKSAPFIFTKVGDFIVKCLVFLEIHKMVNYIDDFLICAPSQETCQVFMNTFLLELRRFGFSCNTDKIINPNTRVKYLGIEIDTIEMTLSLPNDKLGNVQELISSFFGKKFAT